MEKVDAVAAIPEAFSNALLDMMFIGLNYFQTNLLINH
jgi:hypothetical protein